ncbi:MAG TPA: PEP-CTERM sorting domain-containing protein [Terriglobia bacterium]|nr:PEP-CTERM sorting domain-containing protein [Terriglobia bacterium]
MSAKPRISNLRGRAMTLRIVLQVLLGSMLCSTSTLLADTFNFTPIIVPGSTVVQAWGINASGEIVGDYTDGGGNQHGFVDILGSISTLDVPGSTLTNADGVNAAGQIVGIYRDANDVYHGFLYSGGTFTTLDFPGAQLTGARDINASGQIVGGYQITAGVDTHGFLYDGSTFKPLDYPGASYTNASGVNSQGEIVGNCLAGPCGGTYPPGGVDMSNVGFIYIGGQFNTLPFQADGINDSGTIAGLYWWNSSATGLLDQGGVITNDWQFPGATDTFFNQINNSGDIVGNYRNSDGIDHGFLATPVTTPEPGSGSLTLLALGSASLVFWRRRSRLTP